MAMRSRIPAATSVEVLAAGERPGAEILQPIALAAPEADGPARGARQHEADAAGCARSPRAGPGSAPRSARASSGVGIVEEIDEGVGPGRDHPHAVVLARLLHLAQHPGEVVLEVVDEALHDAGHAARRDGLDAAGQPAALRPARAPPRGRRPGRGTPRRAAARCAGRRSAARRACSGPGRDRPARRGRSGARAPAAARRQSCRIEWSTARSERSARGLRGPQAWAKMS